MRKTKYEEPLVEVITAMPEEVVLAESGEGGGGLENYNPGDWNWGV